MSFSSLFLLSRPSFQTFLLFLIPKLPPFIIFYTIAKVRGGGNVPEYLPSSKSGYNFITFMLMICSKFRYFMLIYVRILTPVVTAGFLKVWGQMDEDKGNVLEAKIFSRSSRSSVKHKRLLVRSREPTAKAF